jgi:hypothetical protein
MQDQPMYGMTDEQERRFFQYDDRLNRLGFHVSSEPIPGEAELWLSCIATSVQRLEQRLVEINQVHKTRGNSKSALYYLSRNAEFDFNVEPTCEQRRANAAYKAQLDCNAAKWDAAFGNMQA